MTIKIRKPSEKWLNRALNLYLSSFPVEERRPWPGIMKPSSPHGPFLKIILVDDGTEERFAGMLTSWHFDDFNYLEQFATAPELRGGGIGAYVLQMLQNLNEFFWVLEVEPVSPDNPMAERRIGFYERNGFTLYDYKYMQPPYRNGLPSIPMRLMANTADMLPRNVAYTLRREVYGVKK